ncbi:hypothetical protein Agub_g8511, partial [Astrephomene gubernaculifera]
QGQRQQGQQEQQGQEQQGVPGVSAWMLECAAGSGNLELLRWLAARAADCGAWSAAVFSRAAHAGCEEVLEWLAGQGCPIAQGEQGRGYYLAAVRGDLATLRCLKRLGYPWGRYGRVFTSSVRQPAPLAALQCLLEEGCPVDWGQAVAAAAEEAEGAGEESEKRRTLEWLTRQLPK